MVVDREVDSSLSRERVPSERLAAPGATLRGTCPLDYQCETQQANGQPGIEPPHLAEGWPGLFGAFSGASLQIVPSEMATVHASRQHTMRQSVVGE